jgi:hypothetical protein
MASITLSELNLSGAELFQDSESFLNDMSDVENLSVQGGGYSGGFSGFSKLTAFTIKENELLLLGYSIETAVTLAKSYSHAGYSAGGGFGYGY